MELLRETEKYQIERDNDSLTFKYIRISDGKTVETPIKSPVGYRNLLNKFETCLPAEVDFVADCVYLAVSDDLSDGDKDEAEMVTQVEGE